jgi:hypothetical protein
MTTLLLYLLRVLPVLCGGYRHLAIENLAFAPTTLRLQANDESASEFRTPSLPFPVLSSLAAQDVARHCLTELAGRWSAAGRIWA